MAPQLRRQSRGGLPSILAPQLVRLSLGESDVQRAAARVADVAELGGERRVQGQRAPAQVEHGPWSVRLGLRAQDSRRRPARLAARLGALDDRDAMPPLR